MLKYILVILLVLFYTSALSAEVYRWLDEKGNAHYTDDFTKIPEAYRPNVKKLEGEEGIESTKKETGTPGKSDEAASKDRLGRGEEYWRARVEEVKGKITELEQRNEGLRLKYNEVTIKYNDSKSSVERANLRSERGQIKSQIDQIRASIEDARNILEKKIPEEAELYGAKPDWVK